jgi:hypothetical protein
LATWNVKITKHLLTLWWSKKILCFFINCLNHCINMQCTSMHQIVCNGLFKINIRQKTTTNNMLCTKTHMHLQS